MTSLCVWLINRNFTFGWIGTLFFGGGTILSIIKYFQPNFNWFTRIDPNSKEFKEQTEKEFNEIYNDNGIFTFEVDSFTIKTTKGIYLIQWSEIKSMLGYKLDNFATDCICLDVFCNQEKNFKITEETAGWFRFLDNVKKALPTIDKSWHIEISTPTFETNLTVIYDKENRSLEEVTNEYYEK